MICKKLLEGENVCTVTLLKKKDSITARALIIRVFNKFLLL